MHDPRIGRFFAIDPLNAKNSPYAFSENLVIDGIELEGLEVVTLNNFAFAPFDDFGFGYHGDGDDRKFGDKVRPWSKLNEGFRTGFRVELDLSNNESINERVFGSFSYWSGKADFSPATLSTFKNDEKSLFVHYFAGNR
jgi:hypothetical protein